MVNCLFLTGQFITLFRVEKSHRFQVVLVVPTKQYQVFPSCFCDTSVVTYKHAKNKFFPDEARHDNLTIVKKIFESSEIYQDKNYRDMRKRLRDITIRLDRLEVLKSL